MPSKKEKPVIVTISVTALEIKVTYSDWLGLNPRKIDRIHDMMHKAWRRERAKMVHADRVSKSKAARLVEEATQTEAEEDCNW